MPENSPILTKRLKRWRGKERAPYVARSIEVIYPAKLVCTYLQVLRPTAVGPHIPSSIIETLIKLYKDPPSESELYATYTIGFTIRN
jgi:hypothetical protein